MALDMTCIATIREDVLRLRHADLVDELDRRQLELASRERRTREPSLAPTRRRRSQHWPLRPVRIH